PYLPELGEQAFATPHQQFVFGEGIRRTRRPRRGATGWMRCWWKRCPIGLWRPWFRCCRPCAVPAVTAPNAGLALWVYNPLLRAGLDLMDAWGFSYRTVLFTWVKLTPPL